MSKMAEAHAEHAIHAELDIIAKPTITFTYKDVYGNRLYYPACKKAHVLCDLMKRRTLTKDYFSEIEDLGFDVKVISNEIR